MDSITARLRSRKASARQQQATAHVASCGRDKMDLMFGEQLLDQRL